MAFVSTLAPIPINYPITPQACTSNKGDFVRVKLAQEDMSLFLQVSKYGVPNSSADLQKIDIKPYKF